MRCANKHPSVLSGKNAKDMGSHSHFEADLLPLERTIELADLDASAKTDTTAMEGSTNLDDLALRPWTALGSGEVLKDTIDLFGDGTCYLVNAPGHLPGHINLLVRNHPNKSSIYLAGDACHDIRLFLGTHKIATWTDDAGKLCCIHVDREKATETIRRIKMLSDGGEEGLGKVEVVFAHNFAWEEDAKRKGKFWPGSL